MGRGIQTLKAPLQLGLPIQGIKQAYFERHLVFSVSVNILWHSAVLKHRPSLYHKLDPKENKCRSTSMTTLPSLLSPQCQEQLLLSKTELPGSLCYSFLWEKSSSKGKGNTVIYCAYPLFCQSWALGWAETQKKQTWLSKSQAACTRNATFKPSFSSTSG